MKLKRLLLTFLFLFFGFGILFVSISRAGMEIAAQDNNDDQVRNAPIEFDIYNRDGSTEKVVYKVPEVTTLPSSPFYGFKKIRDYFWMVFSRGNVAKSKVALLLADKKISEAMSLSANDDNKLAIDASIEAVDKLKYADKLISEAKTDNQNEVRDMKLSMFRAGLAYKVVVQRIGKQFEADQTKYTNVINDLDQFNEQKRAEKESWEN